MPPPSMLETPSTRLMSQSMSASKASRLAPLTVIASFSSFSTWMSWPRSARKTSPLPEILARRRALAGHGLLRHPLQAAGAGVLDVDVALVGDHRAQLRLDRLVRELDLQALRVLQAERLLALGLLELLQGRLNRHLRLLVFSDFGLQRELIRDRSPRMFPARFAGYQRGSAIASSAVALCAMERAAWTDERLDDLREAMRTGSRTRSTRTSATCGRRCIMGFASLRATSEVRSSPSIAASGRDQ